MCLGSGSGIHTLRAGVHVHIYNGILLGYKKDGSLPFVTTWIDLKGILLSNVSQMGEDKYHMISLMRGI